jgi:hypothetical protein
MAVCQFIVAITGTVAASTNLDAQRAAIAFVCFYIYFFASSWGPVAWVVTGTFPLCKSHQRLWAASVFHWEMDVFLLMVRFPQASFSRSRSARNASR